MSGLTLLKKELVRPYMEKYPSTRDSDFELMGRIWDDEMQRFRIEHFGAPRPSTMRETLTTRTAKGKHVLTPAATILRTRLDLQVEFEHLRGEMWDKRNNETYPDCTDQARKNKANRKEKKK